MTEKLTGSAARAAIIKAAKANRAEGEKAVHSPVPVPTAIDKGAMWARAMKAAADMPPLSEMDAY
ncbi:hypothetical protein HJC04_11350 [Rhizobium sp. NLR8a]|uniref:hypothetical protein n=1 Tax=Rhizobium TaxID=379 RepID=UPI001C8303A6|nr:MULTISPECIES: hypothetical protein [Rhizobium]MBX5153224.1 hypothetical protein [Rhizobium lentis]MBX5220897.1 hypothetical protein [Rhizobium sp. NLR8a]